MPEMKVETAENPRKAIREARQRRLELVAGAAQTIKVYAGNENMRRILRHSNGTRFRAQLDQPVEWPNDSFTHRRIADGSVRTDGPAPQVDAAEPDPTKNPREQAAATQTQPQPQPAEQPEQQPAATNGRASTRRTPANEEPQS
jgi:hypothetical protein